MPAKQDNHPFVIHLEVEFLDRLSEPVRERRAKSVSDLIRTALEHYDFDNLLVIRPAHVPISVRLPAAMRQRLKQFSRDKHTSIGQLVRTAVETHLRRVESGETYEPEMPIPYIELPEAEGAAVVPPASARPARPRRKKPVPAKTGTLRPKPEMRKRTTKAQDKAQGKARAKPVKKISGKRG